MREAIKECIQRTPTGRKSIYTGYILEYRQRLLHPRQYVYCITDMVIQASHGPRALFLSLQAGIQLYAYINGCGRFGRIPDLFFEFEALTDRQKVTGFRAFDPAGWVLDNPTVCR